LRGGTTLTIRLQIAVAIATAGRRDVLTATIDQLARQTRLPDRLVICPASPEDVDEAVLAAFPANTLVVHGPRGSSHQRNTILRSLPETDLVAFFDDDFLAQPTYLEAAERHFLAEPTLMVATGRVIADGIHGPGILVSEGLDLLAADPYQTAPNDWTPTYNGYGCNMVVRFSVAGERGIEFDERLPLYGWWEDVDFCRQLAPYGLIGRFEAMRGVHLGSKRGRSPGKQLGYSQVANIVYLMRKGTVSRSMGIKRIMRNVVANGIRSLRPEPWVDRRGRLIGNLIAIGDLLVCRIAPERASSL
jgi:GT2 family glycosyltransferase